MPLHISRSGAKSLASLWDDIKEVHKTFYMVKGYITSDEIAKASLNGYIRRLWWNEEAYRYEEGFEEAYAKKFPDRV